ncbi:MAG TPA: hypothetical protein VMC43_01535 [Candidatus Paceibacterota bacterium]|nr:hypothetical protein [Candidatus Paceibacterota bacterium]
MDLLAIMGRGIQMLGPNDPKRIESYVLTEDLEICDEMWGHLAIRIPADDRDPHCVVGGGDLNFAAGFELICKYHPKMVVCAYGDRSTYLKSVDGPSESEVMSEMLQREFDRLDAFPVAWEFPKVVVWPRTRVFQGASNTKQEIVNILDLALEHGLTDIGIVTVGVHVPRTAAFVARNVSGEKKYRDLNATCFESEAVMLASIGGHVWTEHIKAIRNSQAFARTAANEARGTLAFLQGKYLSAKEGPNHDKK